MGVTYTLRTAGLAPGKRKRAAGLTVEMGCRARSQKEMKSSWFLAKV